MSITDNTSNILRKDASDILSQIRKRAEDISTSEGSNFIFYNLSNPTNLTNPQIITIRKNDNFLPSEIAKNSNRHFKKRKTRNISIPYRRRKEMDDNSISNLHDQFLINEEIKRLILRKKENITFNKSYKQLENSKPNKKEFFQLTRIRKLGNTLRKNKSLNLIGEEGKEIWDKLKDNIKNKKDKTVRVNENKNTIVKQYISETKDIQLLKFIHKNKREKLNMLVNIRQSEIDTLNSNIESLENSKDLIMTNYDKKYIKYINYLKRHKDNEEKAYIDLLIKSGSIKKEIFRLQTKISKVQREKTLKLNLILLFIQIKEKIKTVPDMALILFGSPDKNYNTNLTLLKRTIARDSIKRLSIYKNININNINENNLHSDDLKKIMKYKGKMIYYDADEVFYDLHKMEENVRKKILENEELKIEIKSLKEKYKQIKEEEDYDPDDERKQHLNNILNKLKNQNEQLVSELKSIIIKFNLNKDKKLHKLNKLSIKTTKNYLKPSSSASDILTFQGNRTKTKDQFFNSFQTSENSTIYNPKTIFSFKKYFSIEKFDFNTASNLFLSCYNLYSTAKDNSSLDQDVKLEIGIQRGSQTELENKTILKMIEYILKIYNLLIKEKNIYLADKHLKKKYEKIRDLIDKEKKRMRLIEGFKRGEEKQKEKLKNINFKKDKFIYIPTRKIENKYFFKAQKDKENKANLKVQKFLPGFEDFMFDVMV